MKTKRVNRYYCDWCKKSGCSAPHMVKHEKHCTMNPDRQCRVCDLLQECQEPIGTLIALLPIPSEHSWVDEFEVVTYGDPMHRALTEALPKLREAAHECPACILAAIRQRGIPVPMMSEFSFTDEMKAVLDEVNKLMWEGVGMAGCY